MTAGAVCVPTIVPLRAPQPGQHKTCIDINTKVELKSDTKSASIYYTTNGDKPSPFETVSPAAKNTFLYKEPFRLPSGKRTIKAVAVAEDGIRESHVVTKTFDVEYVPPDHEEYSEDGLGFINDIPRDLAAQKEVKKFAHKMVTGKEAWAEVQKMKAMNNGITGSNRHRPTSGTRNLNSRIGNTTDRSAHSMEAHYLSLNNTKRQPPDNATQTMRLQRETDFMKCVSCFAPRPADPHARFCNECGNPVAPLPTTRITPPEAGQMGTCVHCKTVVPFNAPTCLVCEEPLGVQNQPQAAVKLYPKIVCVACGTGNPANLTTCVTCETKLPATGKPIYSEPKRAPAPKVEGRMVACSKCGRANNGDARFCDWCGSKPAAATHVLVCTHCHANNHAYATFCGNCGVLIEPPQTADPRNPGVCLNNEARTGQAKWMPVALPGSGPPTRSVQTQTVGLFYPSQKGITAKITEEDDKIAMEKQMRDRRPLMTAVSPGRGYWRKQIEHICAHLKAHTQNNAEFRSLIAEPRMGKIFATSVHEDGHELSLTVNFALRGTSDPFTGEKLGYSHRDYLSSYTEGRRTNLEKFPSEDSLNSGMGTSRSLKGKKKKKGKVSKKSNKEEPKLNSLDKALLQMIGKNGEGRPSEIQDLIDEGADPCCVNKDGVPALHVAVRNNHLDAVPVLVQGDGEDVDRKGPNGGNTALHECVGLGTQGIPMVDTLLGCGANSRKKNDKGETPYDLAVKEGEHQLAERLAAKLGQSTLDKLIKPKASIADVY